MMGARPPPPPPTWPPPPPPPRGEGESAPPPQPRRDRALFSGEDTGYTQYKAMHTYCRTLPASTNRCQTKCIYPRWDL